jgi:hypothetical protein
VMGIFEIRSQELFAQTGLELKSSHLTLPSSHGHSTCVAVLFFFPQWVDEYFHEEILPLFSVPKF